MEHGCESPSVECDLVLVGGRVVDPASGFDAVANVGITGGSITVVTIEPVRGQTVLDVAGRVVAPGWIDLHSHAQTVAGSRLQAHDGVTTALDLEAGALDLDEWHARAGREGRATSYGCSAAWQQARMVEVGGLPVTDLESSLEFYGDPGWKAPATARQREAILARVEAELAAGAIGIGVLQGYAPRVDPREYLAISRLAAEADRGTFTHARDLVEQLSDVPVDGAEEIVRAAEETGVRAHYCHVNSTSMRHVDRVHRLVERSPGTVTTEAYPYGAGATAMSADFLSPQRLAERGLRPSAIVHGATGRRVTSAEELDRLRASDPGAVAIVHFLDETDPHDQAVLDRCQTFPRTVVASDAMPLTWPAERLDPYAWPPPPGTAVHPRTGGTFSRFWRRYVRELAVVSVLDAVRRCSLGPAQVLEPFVPAMRRKGRVQPGCDADLVVLDLDRVSDESTYSAGSRTSVGYDLVLVGGTVVVRGDQLVLDALPGRSVRAG